MFSLPVTEPEEVLSSTVPWLLPIKPPAISESQINSTLA